MKVEKDGKLKNKSFLQVLGEWLGGWDLNCARH
jgi:hypothetical protein